MAKPNPEQKAFQHSDKVDERDQMDEAASLRLSQEANAVQNDKVSQKPEEFKVADSTDAVEKSLVTLMASIAEKASRLPAEMRESLVASNADFINPALLAVVRNPQDFMLSDQQDPQAVKSFLAKLQA